MTTSIDELLRSWPYVPSELSVRLVSQPDRDVIQMRVDLGVLQLETTGRPDGQRPGDAATYFELIERLQEESTEPRFVLDDEQCSEVDREFIQFYHRRICWLKLQNYAQAVRDADHSLRMMDFCREHSPNEYWTISHEQYRPFVLFHRIQAAALSRLEDDGPQAAVEALDEGVDQLKAVFASRSGRHDEAEEQELLSRLQDVRESLNQQFDEKDRLQAALQQAIAAERYEDAARLRDQLARFEA